VYFKLRNITQLHLYRQDVFAEPPICPVVRKPGTGTLQIIPFTYDNMAQVRTTFYFGLNTIFVMLQEQHSIFINQLNGIL
jgi:hypothetical protein